MKKELLEEFYRKRREQKRRQSVEEKFKEVMLEFGKIAKKFVEVVQDGGEAKKTS